MNKKSYNLQFMRFIGAVLVLLSHSYPITTGSKETELLYRISNGQISFGGLAVAFFFFVSGFFSVEGVKKENRLISYLRKRLKRLLPPLMIVIILSVIFGAFLSEYSVVEYFLSWKTWVYLFNCFMIPIHNLPGVFLHQPYTSTVNGALWTLPVEFLCYFASFIFVKMKLKKNIKVIGFTILVVLTGIIGYYLSGTIGMIPLILRPCILFYIGMLYATFQDRIKKSIPLFLLCIFATVVTTLFNGLEIAMLLAFPYLIYFVSFMVKHQIPKKIAQIGNLSYGMYLVGFPIQQFLVNKRLTLFPIENFIFALLLDVIIAIVISLITNNFERMISLLKREKDGKKKA